MFFLAKFKSSLPHRYQPIPVMQKIRMFSIPNMEAEERNQDREDGNRNKIDYQIEVKLPDRHLKLSVSEASIKH